ncbi:sugar ABC transporter substrate-binding protein [Alteromonas oceanisediminis]|uniref:sugar ABC transporter substrate-binding protein n=1 Tax=Alteromonas oceanisediminis TaxID=2836180 RepID=UPI001BD9AE92|nr:extracellular solute-binding protein [Alteromonas oceanisediminis]MBT0587839.1 extracellular solute-binding protein [Alteromonas oceanisediminis]
MAESLTIWSASEQLEDVLTELAATFSTQNPHQHVTIVTLPNEELKTSIVKTVMAGNAPDIAIFSSDNLVYANVMKLSAIDPETASLRIAPFLTEQEMAALQVDSIFYGIPLQRYSRLLMLYNKRLVQTPACSWEALIAQAAHFRENRLLPVGVLYAEPYWFAHFVSVFDGKFVQNGKPALDSPAVAQALDFFRSLATKGVIDDQCGYDCVSVDFFNGKVAYALNGVWSLRKAHKALGDDLGIAPLPSYRGNQMTALSSLVALSFPNNSLTGENGPAIHQFVEFLQTEEAQRALLRETHSWPLDDKIIESPSMVPLVHAQRQLSSEIVLMPASRAFVSIWSGMRRGLKLHQRQRLSAQASADFMQKQALIDFHKMSQSERSN